MSLSCEAGADIEYYSQDTMQNISAQSPVLRPVQGNVKELCYTGKVKELLSRRRRFSIYSPKGLYAPP